MSLKYLLTQKLVSCSPETSVTECARIMREKDVGAILITDDGTPKGVITDRDIVLRCLADQADCAKVKVKEVMSKVVETISYDEGLFNVCEKMKKAHIRRLPVIDNNRKAIGLLSLDDVFQLLGQEVSNLADAVKPLPSDRLQKVA